MKYYKTYTLGCKVNTYETQAVSALLEKEGYQESKDDRCDLIIVNTCAVTLTSESKSRQKIRSLKKLYPNAVMFVMGCYSQLHPEQVEKIEGDMIVMSNQITVQISRRRVKEVNEAYAEYLFVQLQKQMV